ncbi:MAG: MBOAT family O-acyltransferase [Paenibacillaceae bacterium]
MLFHTPEFFVLLIITLVLYYLMPNRRTILLSIANVLFYSVSGLGFLVLFLSITTITYLCSLMLQSQYRRIFLWLAIVINVIDIAFFKYSLFLLHNVERVFSIQLVATNSFWVSIVLPVGISFYTFELISYVVDVYKKKTKPAQSLLDFWIFIAFFAHLIAGPIMRGQEFIPQINAMKSIRLKLSNFKIGLFYLVLGLSKKILLADNLSPIVNRFFEHPETLDGSGGWMGSYLFAFQIYFDFSAYSDMAVGIGYLFGLELPRNFLTPYLSAHATEFWRRWHITLSSWIRDYLYISLGGSRRGEFRKYINLFIAMTLSGIWHGAQWTFVLWGMFHGGLLIAHNLFVKLKVKLKLGWLEQLFVYRIFAVIVFFHLTCVGWVLFRVHNWHAAFGVIQRMLSLQSLHVPHAYDKYLLIVLGLFVLHIIEYYLITYSAPISQAWHRFFPSPVRAAFYVLIVSVLIISIKSEVSGFIYFQF